MVPPRQAPAGDQAAELAGLAVHAFDIPVDGPDGKEQDGTLTWESVTQPLLTVLPAFRDEVPVYGSGGFTNYPLPVLTGQFARWAEQGLPRMKLKTSRDQAADPQRLTAVRKEVGDDVELFTDANGALSRKAALYWAHRFALLPGRPTCPGLEYFHTHVRIEHIAFDGNLSPRGGALRPDPGRPGLGVEVKWPDLERYRVYGRSRA